mmetsp:Transcript_64835/g.122964  ORF Transcript_64835/g.122964 Transcript_64835/m.122964 type:complete len:270 (-) Transcript_64835:206-1015(-)
MIALQERSSSPQPRRVGAGRLVPGAQVLSQRLAHGLPQSLAKLVHGPGTLSVSLCSHLHEGFLLLGGIGGVAAGGSGSGGIGFTCLAEPDVGLESISSLDESGIRNIHAIRLVLVHHLVYISQGACHVFLPCEPVVRNWIPLRSNRNIQLVKHNRSRLFRCIRSRSCFGCVGRFSLVAARTWLSAPGRLPQQDRFVEVPGVLHSGTSFLRRSLSRARCCLCRVHRRQRLQIRSSHVANTLRIMLAANLHQLLRCSPAIPQNGIQRILTR